MKSLRPIYSYLILASLTSALLLPAAASAHQTGFDGAMAATLHFAPDDDPVAGLPTAIKMIDLKNTGKFAPADCDCTLTVSQDDRQLARLPLSSSGNVLQTSYKFPTKGVYQLHFIGQPKSAGAFAPFDIKYTQRLERAVSAAPATSANFLLLGVAGLLVAGLTAAGLWTGLKGKA